MSDFEKELEQMAEQAEQTPEEKLPSLEEQKQVVAKLKEFEEKGELTPEVLEECFGKFFSQSDTPVH